MDEYFIENKTKPLSTKVENGVLVIEIGEAPVHKFFDKMIKKAAENGSLAVEENLKIK